MVSRIGLCLQIASLSLFGGDYYFTYSLASNNLIVSFEKLQISRKMTPTDSKPKKFFNIPNDKKTLNEKEFITNYKNEILELILAQKTSVESTSKVVGSVATEYTVVRSLPTLVSIDFNEDFAIIGLYE